MITNANQDIQKVTNAQNPIMTIKVSLNDHKILQYDKKITQQSVQTLKDEHKKV